MMDFNEIQRIIREAGQTAQFWQLQELAKKHGATAAELELIRRMLEAKSPYERAKQNDRDTLINQNLSILREPKSCRRHPFARDYYCTCAEYDAYCVKQGNDGRCVICRGTGSATDYDKHLDPNTVLCKKCYGIGKEVCEHLPDHIKSKLKVK